MPIFNERVILLTFSTSYTGNSLERIQQYIEIEQEPKPTENGLPPAYWPPSGDLNVESLSARYLADAPKVFHDVSFHVKSGENAGFGE